MVNKKYRKIKMTHKIEWSMVDICGVINISWSTYCVTDRNKVIICYFDHYCVYEFILWYTGCGLCLGSYCYSYSYSWYC